MASDFINVPEMALRDFSENSHRIEAADLYGDQISTIIEHLVQDGKITKVEMEEIEDSMLDMVAESEHQRFIDGVRYGVQFMTFAMQGIETNEPVSRIKVKHIVRNRAHYGE